MMRYEKQGQSAARENIPRKSSSKRNFRKSFHEGSRMFLPHLWLLFILAFITFPMALSLNNDIPGISLMWLIMLLLSLSWAGFASCELEE